MSTAVAGLNEKEAVALGRAQPDWFVICREGSVTQPHYTLSLPVPDFMPPRTAACFANSILFLRNNPDHLAVRFKIDGDIIDWDPNFMTRKTRNRPLRKRSIQISSLTRG